MHPADIKASLTKSGFTQESMADLLGVTQSFVSHVIHGRLKNRPIAAAIAAAIKKPISEIWPGLYEHEGRARRGRPRIAA